MISKVLCFLLNSSLFILIYLLFIYLNVFVFVLLLYFTPVVINWFTMIKGSRSKEKSKIVLYIIISSGITTICYSVFAFFFEKSSNFSQFQIMNSETVNNFVSIEISSDFFAVSQSITMFIICFSALFLLDFRKKTVMI